MLELKKGVDILTDVGGVSTIAEARAIIDAKLDAENLKKLAPIKNEEALIKIAAAINMCEPDRVFINTGNEADCTWIRNYSLEKGEEKALAKKGHTIHFDLPEDQARLVNQTFYIVNEDEKTSAMAKKVLRSEGHAYVTEYMKGIMKGMTMMVGFCTRPSCCIATATTSLTPKPSAAASSSPTCTVKGPTVPKTFPTHASSWIVPG